ncbi:hypothetical protein ACFQEX_21970 [Roseibium salinum]|uniref:hypothetical protein n=1 Tax=Roseibium salinum TaxID=1604349 RepID=UPI00360678A8
MNGIVAQEVRIGFNRSEIVDADNFDVGAAGFDDAAQDIPADAAKTIDCYLGNHIPLPQSSAPFEEAGANW